MEKISIYKYPYSYPITEVQTSEDHFFMNEKLISLWNVSPEDFQKYYSSDQNTNIKQIID